MSWSPRAAWLWPPAHLHSLGMVLGHWAKSALSKPRYLPSAPVSLLPEMSQGGPPGPDPNANSSCNYHILVIAWLEALGACPDHCGQPSPKTQKIFSRPLTQWALMPPPQACCLPKATDPLGKQPLHPSHTGPKAWRGDGKVHPPSTLTWP